MAYDPRYIVTKAPGVGGLPIPDDEPVLVIRAQDVLALPMINIYMAFYAELDGADLGILIDLGIHKATLLEWQNEHGTKVPDR